jgi:hypothetical protein
MSLWLRLAAGALALPLIGGEEADKLQTLNDLLGNRSRNQGFNQCVAWTATAKRVDRVKRSNAVPRVRGHGEACPSVRPGGVRVIDGDNLRHGGGRGAPDESNLELPIPCSFQSSP